MLSRNFRLKKKKDFERVQKKGKTIKSDFLVLKFTNNDKEETRVGFVCSKKVSKKAVTRNQIKRRLRQAVKDHQEKLKLGYDVVFFAKQNIREKDSWAIQKGVESCLKESKLLK